MRKKKDAAAGAAAAGFLLIILTALAADILAPFDPWARFDPYRPPGGPHLLGTNDNGHDIFSELIHGSRVSLLVGFGAAAVATGIGLLLGLLSGYFRGRTDTFLMGLTDIVLMIPRIPLIIVLAAFLRPGFELIALVIGLLWWTSTARVVRSRTLQAREMGFVESARCLGFSGRRILFSDILPQVMHVVRPQFMLAISAAMIAEASLSFIGLGDAAVKSWGGMLHFAFTKGGLVNGMWWWFLPPGLAVALTVGAVNLSAFSEEAAATPSGNKP